LLNQAFVTKIKWKIKGLPLQTKVKYGLYLFFAATPFKQIKAPGRYAHLHNIKRKFCNAEKSQRYLTEGSCGA